MAKSTFTKDAVTLLQEYAEQYTETDGNDQDAFFEDVEKEIWKISPLIPLDKESIRLNIKVCSFIFCSLQIVNCQQQRVKTWFGNHVRKNTKKPTIKMTRAWNWWQVLWHEKTQEITRIIEDLSGVDLGTDEFMKFYQKDVTQYVEEYVDEEDKA